MSFYLDPREHHSSPKEVPVRFFPDQLKWLEQMFPERVFPPDTPAEVLRDYFGQRRVLLAIRERLQR